MSKWTHAICEDCWDKKNPDRLAHRLKVGALEACCFCGTPTRSGIYVRHDPQDPKLTCNAGAVHAD